MKTGYYYKNRKINWSAFEVDKFVPHLFYSSTNGCGANALALLTGVPPFKIENTNRKNPNDWTDRFMLNFLKKHGFITKEITKCDVTNKNDIFCCENLNDQHVLLFSQLVGKNVASWSVIFNNLWYHNFQTCAFKGLNVVNSPTLSCYLIKHPKWVVSEF